LQATTLASIASSFVQGAEPSAQSEIPAEQSSRWLGIAEKLKSKLRETVKAALNLVQPVADSITALAMDPVVAAAALNNRLLRDGNAVVIDLGSTSPDISRSSLPVKDSRLIRRPD
jgi:hypothetical protein